VIRVLVIDDDPFILRMIDRMLASPEYVLTLAQSGPEGFEAYRQGLHDIVITDVAMPVHQGLQMIGELRALEPSLPILVISGGGWLFNGAELLTIASQAGATEILGKPFTSQQLTDAISHCVLSAKQRART
jgi:CheY-like chemotaxis protein